MVAPVKWIDGERIRCVSCRRWVGLISVRRADGHCPVCDAPIDLNDERYVSDEK